MFNLKTVTREYNCTNYLTLYQFTMTPTDILYVYLVNDRKDTGGFEFNFTIQTETNGSQVNLTCRSPWTTPLITTQTSTKQTTTTPLSTEVSSIEICSNETQIGEEVSLYRRYRSGGSCGCSVTLVGGEGNSLVTFPSTRAPRGCQYKLMFNLKTVTREYSCSNYLTLYQFNMTPTDNLYVYLVNYRNDRSGFTFNFTIQPETHDQRVVVACSSPWVIPMVTTQTSSTTGDNNIHYTSTTGTSGESESTETTDRSKTTEDSQSSDLPVIVGCTVGGVFLISVIVVMLMCFWHRRKQKQKTGQDASDQNVTERHVYSNIVPDNSSQTQHQNTVNIPNNVYSSLDNTSSDLQQYQHLQKQENHITEQQERVSEQQGDVPHANNEYVNVPEKSLEGSSPDNEIEHNKIPPQNMYSSLSPTDTNSIDYRPYEHLPKQERFVTEQQEDVPGQYENALKQ